MSMRKKIRPREWAFAASFAGIFAGGLAFAITTWEGWGSSKTVEIEQAMARAETIRSRPAKILIPTQDDLCERREFSNATGQMRFAGVSGCGYDVERRQAELDADKRAERAAGVARSFRK